MGVNVRVIPIDNEEDLRVNVDGFCEDTKTLTFTAHPHCVHGYQGSHEDGNVNLKINNYKLLDMSLDYIGRLDNEAELWIAINGPCSIEDLFKVIDSPDLHYNKDTNKVYERGLYYFDKNRGVCIQVSVDDTDKNGYHLIRRMWTTRAPKKIERVNNFIYGYCTRNPIDIPAGQTRDDVNHTWNVEHGLIDPNS